MNTVFSAMKDLDNLSHPKPLFISSKIRWISSFVFSTKVIELDNFSYGRIIVVSQDTTVCVYSFPKILHTIHPFLSLNHKSNE